MFPPVQTVASAAGGSNSGGSLICIWDVQNGTCRKTISYHSGAVQSLAFSRDDHFFLSVGQLIMNLIASIHEDLTGTFREVNLRIKNIYFPSFLVFSNDVCVV